jgi:hypothetical protein
MSTKSIKIAVSPAIGKVSAILMAPPKASAIITLAHGAGAGMDHVFMNQLATALSAVGLATLRFNFPFMEQQKKRPDTPAVAHQTIEAAINKVRELYPSLPFFVAGKSFGGRMTSQYLATNDQPDIKGLIFYGFPLHPAGKPGIDRAEHLKKVKVPMLFLQGTRDTLATWDLIESVCKSLKKATLVKLEGADHSFKAGKTDTIALLTKATQEWIEKQARKAK